MRLFLALSFLIISALAYADAPSAMNSPRGGTIVLAANDMPGLMVLAPAPAPSPSPMVQVAEPAAPPAWAQDLMVMAGKLPFVGPYIDKALLLLGILGSVLTILAAGLVGLLSSLSGVLNWAGFGVAAQKIKDFQNGKILYWIKYFSMFNAKKPESAKLSVVPDPKKPA